MQKTLRSFLYLLIVSGLIFSACVPKEESPILDDRVGPEPTPTPDESSVYEDGEYSADGSYVSPGGPETIGVTLTVEDDVIVAVDIRRDAVNEKSVEMQRLFSEGVEGVVVGMKLDELKDLGPTNGSSLTPKAFNEALALIKAEAVL